MVRVRATASKRRFAAQDQNHEPGQPLRLKPLTNRRRDRTVKRDRVVLALYRHALRRARPGNAHLVILIVIAYRSGRAVSATRLKRVRNNMSDLTALPVPLLWPRHLRMLINQRKRSPRLRRSRRQERNVTSLWFMYKVLDPPLRGERRAREKEKLTMIRKTYAFTGSKLEHAHMVLPVGTVTDPFLLPQFR